MRTPALLAAAALALAAGSFTTAQANGSDSATHSLLVGKALKIINIKVRQSDTGELPVAIGSQTELPNLVAGITCPGTTPCFLDVQIALQTTMSAAPATASVCYEVDAGLVEACQPVEVWDSIASTKNVVDYHVIKLNPGDHLIKIYAAASASASVGQHTARYLVYKAQ